MQISGFLPFILAIEGKSKINTTRIVEAIIIAAIGGLVAGFITTKELKVEVSNIKCNIQQLSDKIGNLDNRLWSHQTATEK